MSRQNCLTNDELRSLLSANPRPEHTEFLQHLDVCSTCQENLASISGDSSWIGDLKLAPDKSAAADNTVRPSHETELANVMNRMSDKTVTAFTTSESGSASLSFQGLPYTDKIVAGKRIGSYEILSLLGVGGMSVVFAARDHVLDRKVAIKFLSSDLENSRTARQRFLREAKSAAAVEHDFIVPIYSADEIDGFPFLVMSHIMGQSLQQRIDASETLSTDAISRIGIQIAKGLGAFHARDLVHRDLKPSNILLQKSDGRVRITDFGLAKCIDDNQLTKTGTVLGTPHYMSPEQALGKRVDYRSDIYGLGAVLYAATTGKAPYNAATALQILHQLREQKPRSILDLKPDVPLWLVQIIEKLMARNPEERYQNSEEIVNALSAAQPLLPENRPDPQQAPPSGNRFSIAAICAAVTLLAASYLAWYLMASPSTKLAKGQSTPAGEQKLKDSELAPGNDPSTNTQDPSKLLNPQDFRVTIKRDEGESPEFESLGEAVRQAMSGDIIEIEGDGTQSLDATITTDGKQLTIRALPGSEPVLEISSKQGTAGILSDVSLELEGLTFRIVASDDESATASTKLSAVRCVGGSLRITNCKFEITSQRKRPTCCIAVVNANSCDVRNSEFYSGTANVAIDVGMVPGTDLNIENNVHCGEATLAIIFPTSQARGQSAKIRIRQNTIQAITGLLVSAPFERPPRPNIPVLIEADANLWDVYFLASLATQRINDNPGLPRLTGTIMRGLFRWQGEKNQYRIRHSFFGISQPRQKTRRVPGPVKLSEWDAYWGQTNTGSRQLVVPVQDTGLFERDQPSLVPRDFLTLLGNLKLSSGESSIGAQTEIVGPGLEYTNWILSQTQAN